MNARDELWPLWSRFLSGLPLDPAEERRLVEALAADEALRRDVLDDEGLHGALREMGRAEAGLERFAARMEKLVDAERGADDFAARFSRRLAGARRSRRVWLSGTLACAGAAMALVFWLRSTREEPSARRPPAQLAAVAPAPLVPTASVPAPLVPAVTPATSAPGPATGPSGQAPPLPYAGAPNRRHADAMPAAPAGTPVFAFSHGGGVPKKLVARAGERCPPRPGFDSDRCLAAVLFDERLRALSVRLGDDDGLFRFSDDLVLVFDYWIGAWVGDRAPRLDVTLRVKGLPRTDYSFFVEHPRPATWQRAVIPLRDLRNTKPPGSDERPGAGERIVLIKLVTDSGTQDVLYVDGLRVLRP